MIAGLSTATRRGVDVLALALYVTLNTLAVLFVLALALLGLGLTIALSAFLTAIPVVIADGHWLGWVGAVVCGLFAASTLLKVFHSIYLFLTED